MTCTLLSCENGGQSDGPNGGPNAIAFGEVATRAVATVDDVKKDGFGVYAFVSGVTGSADENTYTSLFGEVQERVYWDDTLLGLTYDNIKFWEPNRKYHFLGVYPYGADYAIEKDFSGAPTGISRSFTTPDTADVDMLVAYSAVNTAENTPESVTMNFGHALSMVNFVVGYDTDGNKDDRFVLKEFTISNIKKVGVGKTAFNGGSTSWSVDQMQNMSFTWDDGFDFKDQGKAKINLWGENGLMLIPQTIALGAVTIKVVYDYLDHYLENDEDFYADPVEKELNISLPAITWVPGVQYTYTMTLHEDDLITFSSIELKPWGSPQQGGAIIIK